MVVLPTRSQGTRSCESAQDRWLGFQTDKFFRNWFETVGANHMVMCSSSPVTQQELAGAPYQTYVKQVPPGAPVICEMRPRPASVQDDATSVARLRKGS